jgi:hypothetical protein
MYVASVASLLAKALLVHVYRGGDDATLLELQPLWFEQKHADQYLVLVIGSGDDRIEFNHLFGVSAGEKGLQTIIVVFRIKPWRRASPGLAFMSVTFRRLLSMA